MRRKKRKCIICGIRFIPNKYNWHHQVTCGRKECQQEHHRCMCRKNRVKKSSKDMEYRKKESERVKEWQREHPDYKRKQREKREQRNEGGIKREFSDMRNGANDKNEAERDVLRDVATLGNENIEVKRDVLRDVAKKNEKKFNSEFEMRVEELGAEILGVSRIVIGWLSHTCNVLRDDIGEVLEELYAKGEKIGVIDLKTLIDQPKGGKSYEGNRITGCKT